jgi:hypothetical protein
VAYDEDLADRIRAALPGPGFATEQRMFGGLAFMLGGHMACGVVGDRLMLRLGPDAAARALAQPHVRPMDFTGRPMKGMVFVEPPGYRGAALDAWLAAAAEHVRSLPARKPRPPSRKPGGSAPVSRGR